MSENLWKELARSPLDPDPEYERPVVDWLIPIAIAAVLGLVVGLVALGDDPDPATTSSTAIAATSSSVEAVAIGDPEPIVPDGYVDAGGIGLRAVAAYGRNGNLYVVVNQAARSDTDPIESALFHASHWSLTGPESIEAERAIASTLSPGTLTLEFLGVASVPSSGANVVVREASPMVVRTSCNGCGATSSDQTSGEVILEGLTEPYSLNEPLLVEVTAGITLSIDRLDFTNEWGYATWHAIDENDARLRVELRVLFEGTDDPDREGTNPTQLVPDHLLGASQQNPSPANLQSFARRGSLQLERVGELITGDNQPTAFVLSWSVEWQHPVGDPIEIAIDDASDFGIVD